MTRTTSPQGRRRRRERDFLTRELERDLVIRWHRHADEKALAKLLVAHDPLLMGLARAFRSYGLSEDDLRQEGRCGLLRAVRKFDPDRGIRFATYAAWWAKAAMQEFVFRNRAIVGRSLTTTNRRLFFMCRSVFTYLEKRHPDWDRLRIQTAAADVLGVMPSDVSAMAALFGQPEVSIDAQIFEGGGTIADTLVDDAPGPDQLTLDSIDGERLSAKLRRAIRRLKPREQAIMKARWLSDERKTLDELGRIYDISHERVRQIEGAAFSAVQAAMLGHPDAKRSRSVRRRAAP